MDWTNVGVGSAVLKIQGKKIKGRIVHIQLLDELRHCICQILQSYTLLSTVSFLVGTKSIGLTSYFQMEI